MGRPVPLPAFHLLLHSLDLVTKLLHSGSVVSIGGFNEQALANVLFAFDNAGVQDVILAQHVFNVAGLRLLSRQTAHIDNLKSQVRRNTYMVACKNAHIVS